MGAALSVCVVLLPERLGGIPQLRWTIFGQVGALLGAVLAWAAARASWASLGFMIGAIAFFLAPIVWAWRASRNPPASGSSSV